MITTDVKQLKAFVSAPARTDLSTLLEVLKANNISILHPDNFAPGAVKITDKLIDGINHADLVVAVLGSDISSHNVLFELGCAFGLGKKTLVIIPEDSKVPSDLTDLVYIKSNPNNREAIEFALEQIINAPEPKINPTALLVDKSKPLGDIVDNLLEHSSHFTPNYSEKGIYNIVREILISSGIETKVEPKYSHIRPDFAVWIDELEPYLGNPILIEVKKELSTAGQAHGTVEQVLHYMSLSNTMAVIIFTFKISSEAINVLSSYPNLYFFEIGEFLELLRQSSFAEIIRKERNARFHGRL